MKAKDAEIGAALCVALKELPKVRRALSDKPPDRFNDCVHLELQAAKMNDGESQGSSHYFNVPPKIGRVILDATDKIIRAELRRLGVEP